MTGETARGRAGAQSGAAEDGAPADGAVAVFVKTPGSSSVKTRLAATAGSAFATDFYRLAVAATASVVQAAAAASGCRAYWAVAEPEALRQWQGGRFAVIAQPPGSLGQRMGSVHTTLVARHGRAVLIGADSPQLEAGDLSAALAGLASPLPTLMLGPAADGGFWLVGANRVLPLADWCGVAYSRADTRAQFERRMQAHARRRRLRALGDVDEAADLIALLHDLAALRAPTAAQTALYRWPRQQRLQPGGHAARAAAQGAALRGDGAPP